MDPATAAAMGLAPSIIGSKQLGAPAPMFQPGGGSPMMGLLDDPEKLAAMMAELAQSNNFGSPAPETVDPLSGLVGSPLQGPAGGVGPPTAEQDPLVQEEKPSGIGGLLEGAFGNVDANLQSPSKVMGLGLLSSIDPRLAQGGLLASALFGPNKLWGK